MKNLPAPAPAKKPSAFGYAMQPLWIPETFVVEKNDEIFAKNYYFANVCTAATAILNAVHVTDMVLRKYTSGRE